MQAKLSILTGTLLMLQQFNCAPPRHPLESIYFLISGPCIHDSHLETGQKILNNLGTLKSIHLVYLELVHEDFEIIAKGLILFLT